MNACKDLILPLLQLEAPCRCKPTRSIDQDIALTRPPYKSGQSHPLAPPQTDRFGLHRRISPSRSGEKWGSLKASV